MHQNFWHQRCITAPQTVIADSIRKSKIRRCGASQSPAPLDYPAGTRFAHGLPLRVIARNEANQNSKTPLTLHSKRSTLNALLTLNSKRYTLN